MPVISFCSPSLLSRLWKWPFKSPKLHRHVLLWSFAKNGQLSFSVFKRPEIEDVLAYTINMFHCLFGIHFTCCHPQPVAISSCYWYVFAMFFGSEVSISTGLVLWHHCHRSSRTLWPQLKSEISEGFMVDWGKLRWEPNSKTPTIYIYIYIILYNYIYTYMLICCICLVYISYWW